MDAAKPDLPPQQEEHDHNNGIHMEKTTTDESSSGELVRNYRGWKTMPYIIGYPCLYTLAPYLVYPAEAGGQGPFYDGVYSAGAYGQGGFLPTWMAV